MAFKPGHKKHGGRKPGTPNKKTKDLLERAEALGIDPFEILLYFAAGEEEKLGYDGKQYRKGAFGDEYVVRITPEMRIEAAKQACQYLHPKRKAIEVSAKDGGPLELYLLMTPEERARKREELEKRLGKKK